MTTSKTVEPPAAGRRVERLVRRSDELPGKFTPAERRAYDWLYDCDIRPWLVDLLTKEVTTPSGKVPGLVEYAISKGMAVK